MSYVDAFYNRDKDIVQVVERVNGKRVYNDFPAWRTFYVKDPRGDHVSIHGDKVRQIKCKRLKDLHKERRINAGKKFYESDLKPEVRCPSENYNGVDSPNFMLRFSILRLTLMQIKGLLQRIPLCPSLQLQFIYNG